MVQRRDAFESLTFIIGYSSPTSWIIFILKWWLSNVQFFILTFVSLFLTSFSNACLRIPEKLITSNERALKDISEYLSFGGIKRADSEKRNDILDPK